MKRKKDAVLNKEELKLTEENNRLRLQLRQMETENKNLKQSAERYRVITASTDDLIVAITFTVNPVYTYVSPSHKRAMGYETEELLGKPALTFIHPKDKKNLLPLLKKYVTAKIKGFLTGKTFQISERLEYRVYDKTGNWHYLQSMANIIEGRDEILLVSRDITDQKIAEQQRRELEERLLQSEKLEAIGALAGGVAHDLNNILSAVVNYPELLLLDIPPDSPHYQPILNIQKAGERAAAIVNDLLTLARRGLVVTEVVQLNDIAHEYFNSPEFEKLKSFHPFVQFEHQPDTQLLNMMGSPVHLGKMIMNLLSNAAEAIEGEGKVEVSTENRYVDHPIPGYDRDVPKGEYVVLKISDTGIGMSPQDVKKIFMPFYSRKTMGRSGTGLGMTVIWGTVKDHKGYIVIDSEEDKGSTFEIFFPATREEITFEKLNVSIDEFKGKGETIVVIDDVEQQREIASMLLSQLGYSVNAAADVEEAFEYLKDRSADLFILDMIMDPKPDGLDTYKRILEKFPGAKAIIASGFSETDRVKEAMKLGAGEYVRKPYTLERIARAVRKELDRKK